MTESNPVVAVCIPAFNEEKTKAEAVVQAMNYVHKFVVCDYSSGDLTDATAGGRSGAA